MWVSQDAVQEKVSNIYDQAAVKHGNEFAQIAKFHEKKIKFRVTCENMHEEKRHI